MPTRSAARYSDSLGPAAAAQRQYYLRREFAAERRRRNSSPFAPYARVQFVSGGLPALGRRQ